MNLSRHFAFLPRLIAPLLARPFPGVAGLLCLLFVGCSSITGERVLPDGSKLVVRSHRFFWSSEGIKASTKDQAGFEFTLEILKSNTHASALKAVAEGVAEGSMRGAKPL